LFQCKPVLVEPIDFETFILKNKTLIQNDPHRELLLYPNDDVSEIIYPKKFRTLSSCMPTTTTTASSPTKGPAPKSPTKNGSSPPPVPSQFTPPQCHLLTREALNTYQTANHIVNYKYKTYSYSSVELPRNTSPEKLKEEVYEVDADPDQIDEQMTRSQADSITKQGYLLKGPDTNAERMLAHIGSRSFKRRYCYLRQEIDGTYILEIHKDEKQIMAEAKTTIVMDFCTEIVLNAKRGPKKDQNRFCFELQMTTGHKSFVFATDDETEYDDWLKKLQSVLTQNKLQDDKRSASLERAPPSPNHNGSGIGSTAVGNNALVYGTLKGLEQSMNPQLIKYGRETDLTIAQARKENRKKLFLSHLYTSKVPGESSLAVTPTTADNLEIYKEPLLIRQRILLKCEQLKFRLLLPMENENGKMCQVGIARIFFVHQTVIAFFLCRSNPT
jgi:dedicator of cytokinesis protein 9/10/11